MKVLTRHFKLKGEILSNCIFSFYCIVHLFLSNIILAKDLTQVKPNQVGIIVQIVGVYYKRITKRVHRQSNNSKLGRRSHFLPTGKSGSELIWIAFKALSIFYWLLLSCPVPFFFPVVLAVDKNVRHTVLACDHSW